MSNAPRHPERRREYARLAVGSVIGFAVKAYGAGAALSVALSDSETVGGKADDAVAAVPNLTDRYQDAKYVYQNREEIQTAVDYVNEHAPDTEEAQRATDESAETLEGLETTYDELVQAKEAFPGLNPFDWNPSDAAEHVQEAWSARPDLQSISDLAEVAEQVSPFVEQVEVLLPVFYGGFLVLMDNFASDEIAGTLLVIGAALAVAWVLATAVGFLARRGRPGLITRALQRWGARLYRRWYVDNVEYALGRPLYVAARERVQSDIVADPEHALDPQSFRALEEYFRGRRVALAPPEDAKPLRRSPTGRHARPPR